MQQEAMKSFAFPTKINSISTEIRISAANVLFTGITGVLPLRFELVLTTQRKMHELKIQAT